MKLSGGDLLMRALKDEGVKLIFGYPGGAALHIYDAIFRQKALQHILVRHEQGATHAADGYSRATGKPGVALVTSGPGATNAITGLATAYMDSIPLIVISGQVQSHLIGTDSFQETDMIGISRPIVKHSFMVQDAEDIPRIIQEAFYIATSGRPGPVVIDIPKDKTDPSKLYQYKRMKQVTLRSYKPKVVPHPGQIKKASKNLLSAERPVIYAGGGVILGDAHKELIALNKILKAPVTNTLMGLGAYPAADKYFMGMLGMHGTYQANMAMHNADVILAIGARFDDRITNTPSLFAPKAHIIHIDVDPASISKIINADIPIVGQVKESLAALIKEIKRSKLKIDSDALDSWNAQIASWRKTHGLNHDLYLQKTKSKMIIPQVVVQELYHATKGNAYVTSDVGQHQMFVAQYYHFNKPRRWINSGGLGTMGFGLPAAMGVKLAYPKQEVVCVTGEGSIQMCIQELSTCLQYNLPIKIININNEALGMVRQWQDMNYGGRYSASTYADSLPDFVKLAESYGHVGMKVTKQSELRQTLDKAFAMTDRLVFIDIYVDPDEHVYPMLVAPNGSLQDMWITKNKKA
ncbi:MAG: acetolactate synthase 3 catalytic subunit [SAR86 cluster bacterium BACL1 MAG-121105-bin34]|jgi:acetolactate synthase I/II/III large subunit|uniref:Acetolactate synthase n=2 Tax=SAR86 cluster TaxID=62672 RepID=A0A0R2UDR5_9GAMM|nr:MAG: acetolactate synthase 3 catalytic subunit [SAR86 cluster bacterium BACL1 MAG-120507-bin14]KRO41150.1 MAG: acetolactate synthase 3 catalytic subunit [SAR86 cluster bacterium BACL1 MAG-120920-bin57]KRO95578.1 MAG: acetolactate synthase 3 catalytic subunit [SAR86 cluster bacterium BACL1 MAG-120820-bin45]KRO97041.1 MAG: acetolactate synthase 3 catalytic subunit [SAR86 cluster bacterium BACL1 MAG-120828-bin5]KRO98454.1 MAG: acetolactate synthase 3 catalytic subunit [SAR86 cluster bacterium B